eukprot:TRINITY_DN696_c0_g2_i4.p1 TRINITY_DN696_c0_g2~~TRINITY_DN696_c0_g2_i4.p1  ORF type:complete len:301 (+),score=79.87 TRINITY_DN696_c0_g2_i4:49-951(+)
MLAGAMRSRLGNLVRMFGKEFNPAVLDAEIPKLAKKFLPLANEILKECIRIPADYVDLPAEQGGDVECGLSNHEKPRLDYLTKMIRENACVEKPEDVFYDEFGNLVWVVEDKEDGIPSSEKKVIYFDGHSDTVRALRNQWQKQLGEGIDAYNGLTDVSKVDLDALKHELGWHVPAAEFEHCIFGRGAADQLAGVVSQAITTKILLALKDQGALKGTIIRSIATVAEEDNDGGSCMHIMRKQLAGAKPEMIPDVVVYTCLEYVQFNSVVLLVAVIFLGTGPFFHDANCRDSIKRVKILNCQ